MPKILVTGGAGYIGSITTHHLLARGYEVVVVDDLSRGHRDSVPKEVLRVVRLQDKEALLPCLEGVDAVVHFAAYIAVGESTAKPELYFSNNVGGTLSLLDAMVKANVRKLVFSSTAAVYGNPESVPIPENARFAPVSPYGETKAVVERILGQLDRFGGLRSVALRYFNACGAEPAAGLGELHDPETHLIPLLFRALRSGQAHQHIRQRLSNTGRHLRSRLRSRERPGGSARVRAGASDEGRQVGCLQRWDGPGSDGDGSVAGGGRSFRADGSIQDGSPAGRRCRGISGGCRKAAAGLRLAT